MALLKKCGPKIVASFVYVSTHYVETVKEIDCNRYVQLTWWPRGYASDCSARASAFDSQIWQGFLWVFCCYYFTFCQKYIIYTIICKPFALLIHFVYLWEYKDTDLSSLKSSIWFSADYECLQSYVFNNSTIMF